MLQIYKKTVPLILGAVFLLLLDRFFKIYSFNYLVADNVPILGDYFKLNLALNPGVAFSIPIGGLMIIILICSLILILIWEFYENLQKNKHINAGVIFVIISGAASNLWDRFHYGYVIDYLDLRYFTVFNIADIMISVGVLILAILLMGKRNKI